MDNIVIQRQFFRPICNEQEIDRIFNVQNASDYLLKLRAETIVDHMRLFRVYRNKALSNPEQWSLERSFTTSHFQRFLASIDRDEQSKCSAVTFGNIFSNDPNGIIFSSEYGPIITLSEALHFFLKFAHLALLSFESDVPSRVRFNALRIAMRVMLKTEAMDFLMDPRGIVPQNIGKAMHAPIPLQMEFIAGHEFAHHILGHLSPAAVSQTPIFRAITPRDNDYKPLPAFTTSQQQEFAADEHSIRMLSADRQHQEEVLHAALVWFACLELYETVADFMCPPLPWKPSSHPTARQRFEHLLDTFSSLGVCAPSRWESLLKNIETLKPLLVDDFSVNIEVYETYGSVYLDEPNSDWRGPELIDRKDYY